MKNNPILLIAGEPKSIFLEIFFKIIRHKKFKSPLVLLCSKRDLKHQMNKFKFKRKIKLLEINKLNNIKLDNKSVNLIDVKRKISKKNKLNIINNTKYLTDCFKIAFILIKKGYSKKLINVLINKENFLQKKYLGITEYISRAFQKKKTDI